MHTLIPPRTCLRRVAAAAGLALLAAAIPAGAQERSQDQEGWRQYMVHCARCHGDDAIGGLMAPDLRSSMQRGAVDDQAFQDVVLHGRRERGMPGFKGVLTAEQVAAIQAYVAARASGKLKAGRPA
jgi:mono/diheme cytochrome c family protein